MKFSPETFGNPNNPFNEAVDIDFPWRLVHEPSRSFTRLQIILMQLRRNTLKADEYAPGSFSRQLDFACRAPYSESMRMFLNEKAVGISIEILTPIVTNMAKLTIGDTYVDGAVVRRWASLSAADGEPFAVSGVGENGQDYQYWDSLTVLTGNETTQQPNVEMWGQPAGENMATRVLDAYNEDFSTHFEALSRALQAQIDRSASPAQH